MAHPVEKQQLGHDPTGMILYINIHGNTCGQTDARLSGASASSCAVVSEHFAARCSCSGQRFPCGVSLVEIMSALWGTPRHTHRSSVGRKKRSLLK